MTESERPPTMQWTADVSQSSLWGHFYRETLARDLKYRRYASWPTEAFEIELDRLLVEFSNEESREMFGYLGETLVSLSFGSGLVSVVSAGATRQASQIGLEELRRRLPVMELGEDQVQARFAFWHHTANGPNENHRVLEIARWDEIQANYPNKTAERLMAMFGLTEPRGGKLFVWHGPPGTGKTWALRALAWEWRKWVDFHYLIEPEKFFGEYPGDLMHVALAGHDSPDTRPVLATEVGSRVPVEPKTKRWKMLVLEDTGEMVAPDAKEHTGQALSRLLNLLDGLIGQGLRVMALITTNETLDKLHPAVTRHGRCGMEIRFDHLSVAEANRWLDEMGSEATVSQPILLADLYAMVNEWTPTLQKTAPIGFRSHLEAVEVDA